MGVMRACPVSDGCDMAVQCLIAGREKRYSEGLVGGPRTSLEKGRGGGEGHYHVTKWTIS